MTDPREQTRRDAERCCANAPSWFPNEKKLLAALRDFGTSERLAALDTLRMLIERAERDASLLDGRDHDQGHFDDAYRLIELLQEKEARR